MNEFITNHLEESKSKIDIISNHKKTLEFIEKQKTNSELGILVVRRTQEIITKYGMASEEHLFYQREISKLLETFLVK